MRKLCFPRIPWSQAHGSSLEFATAFACVHVCAITRMFPSASVAACTARTNAPPVLISCTAATKGPMGPVRLSALLVRAAASTCSVGCSMCACGYVLCLVSFELEN